MPERAERLLWVYGQSVDNVRDDIETAFQSIVSGWTECPVTVHACVDATDSIDRLWLFRLQHGIGNRGIGTRFNKRLEDAVKETSARLGLGKRLKRRTNLPTAVVRPTP